MFETATAGTGADEPAAAGAPFDGFYAVQRDDDVFEAAGTQVDRGLDAVQRDDDIFEAAG